MERLGTPDRVAQGLLVVRVDDRVSVGTDVVDESLDDVGSVVDVFGPVEAPYVAVSPADGVHPPSVLGRPLYVR